MNGSNGKRFVLFALVVGVACFAYFYMVKPANASIAAKRHQTGEKLAKLAELEQVSGQTEDAGKQLEKLQEAVKFFQDKLPAESEIHKVLENITLIAQRQGLQCGAVISLKSKECSGSMEQPLKMEMTGSFVAFYSFLAEMEKLPRIIRIRELELEKNPDRPNLVKANMVLSVFFRI